MGTHTLPFCRLFDMYACCVLVREQVIIPRGDGWLTCRNAELCVSEGDGSALFTFNNSVPVGVFEILI